jgi:hypothetical protein
LPYKLLGKTGKRRIARRVYLVIQLHGRFLPSSSILRNKKASNTTAGDIAKKIVCLAKKIVCLAKKIICLAKKIV